MLLKASQDFNIDLNNSWMVGDGENDVKAGIAAGCKTALIKNSKINEIDDSFGADLVAENLLESIKKIFKRRRCKAY